jgi:hypothetical protein
VEEEDWPQSWYINETIANVSEVAFQDLDLDVFEVGGTIWWVEPSDVSEVTHYAVYLSEGEAGQNKSLVGDVVAIGTTSITVVVDSD